MDISVVAGSAEALRATLNSITVTAGILGLKFNAGKCAFLSLRKAKLAQVEMIMEGPHIVALVRMSRSPTSEL